MMPETVILPLLFLLLVPFAIVGLALINTGLNRTRSAAHSMLGGLCAAAIAVLAFVILGTAIAGPARLLFARGIHPADPPHATLVLLFEIFAVALTAQIPVACGAERWRLSALCVSTAFLAGLLFPYISSLTWGGGFLSQLGIIDAGGAGVIQVLGGFTALSIAWLLGPRQGKFTPDGIPTAMPGHNAVIVVVGSLFALLGWAGLSAAGALLFYPAQANLGQALFAVLNTLVAASGAAIAALITTRFRFGKPDTSLTANGWVCGLVSVSAGAPFFKLPEALLIGLAAGVLVVFAIEVIEVRLRVDDPAGAIGVHAVGGIWGLLGVGLFIGSSGQFLAQVIGVGTLMGLFLPLAYCINALINRFVRHRVEPSGERQGLDLYELGAGAYPEFITHREEFLRR